MGYDINNTQRAVLSTLEVSNLFKAIKVLTNSQGSLNNIELSVSSLNDSNRNQILSSELLLYQISEIYLNYLGY